MLSRKSTKRTSRSRKRNVDELFPPSLHLTHGFDVRTAAHPARGHAVAGGPVDAVRTGLNTTSRHRHLSALTPCVSALLTAFHISRTAAAETHLSPYQFMVVADNVAVAAAVGRMRRGEAKTSDLEIFGLMPLPVSSQRSSCSCVTPTSRRAGGDGSPTPRGRYIGCGLARRREDGIRLQGSDPLCPRAQRVASQDFQRSQVCRGTPRWSRVAIQSS